MEFRRRIVWDGQIAPEPEVTVAKPTYQAPTVTTQPVLVSAPVQVTAPVPKGSKNGHKVEFKRKLTADEAKGLRKWWISKNGCVGWDDAVDYRIAHLPPEITIFQVNGYLTILHKALAKGKETIADVAKYNEHRKARGQSTIKMTVTHKGPIHPKFVALVRPTGRPRSKYLA